MKSGPTNNQKAELLIEEQQKRIESLEHSFAELELRAQKYENEWSDLYDQNKELRTANHRLQHDYETLRLQKGGFGFKMLMISGFIGFAGAAMLCFAYLKLKPKETHVVAFRKFQRENLFDYELAISQGRFDDVEKSLLLNLERPEFRPIEEELVFTKNLIEAAKRRCD